MAEKVRHIIYKLRHDYFTRENSFLIFIFALLALWSGSSVIAMDRSWQQQRALDAEKIELARLEAEVATLEFERKYYESHEYQELAAREKQNKMLPGETMLRLPPNSSAAKAKYKAVDEISADKPSNLQQWLKFLLP